MRDAVLTGLLAFFGAFLGPIAARAVNGALFRRHIAAVKRQLIDRHGPLPPELGGELSGGPTTAHDDTPTPNERGGL